jgi:hypothetical protein
VRQTHGALLGVRDSKPEERSRDLLLEEREVLAEVGDRGPRDDDAARADPRPDRRDAGVEEILIVYRVRQPAIHVLDLVRHAFKTDRREPGQEVRLGPTVLILSGGPHEAPHYPAILACRLGA